jgi:hypothetical protein
MGGGFKNLCEGGATSAAIQASTQVFLEAEVHQDGRSRSTAATAHRWSDETIGKFAIQRSQSYSILVGI